MSEAKFTKGEWGIYQADEERFEIHNPDGNDFFTVICEDVYSHADAHLIAAAPEMYAMLEACAMLMDAKGGLETDAIYRLLAKARGE